MKEINDTVDEIKHEHIELIETSIDNTARITEIKRSTAAPHEKPKSIQLASTSLHESTVYLSPEMKASKTISLTSLNMPLSGWSALVDSLHSVENTIYVMLRDTNIDDKSVSRIVESPDLTVISNSQRSMDGRYRCLCFYTTSASKLKIIRIRNSAFENSGPLLTGDMKKLREISLTSVQMSSECWYNFVESIYTNENLKVYVTLVNTNIDDVSVQRLSSCSAMTQGKEGYKFIFHVRYLCALSCAGSVSAIRDSKQCLRYLRNLFIVIFILFICTIIISFIVLCSVRGVEDCLDVLNRTKYVDFFW